MHILKFFLIALSYSLLIVGFRIEAKTSVHHGGGDGILDPCMSLAQVNNLGKGPDAFLAVKDEPNLKAKRIDKIFSGQKLWICEDSKDGNWYGVVYPTTENQDCDVNNISIKNRKTYTGPCKSGWVSQKYVTIVAG